MGTKRIKLSVCAVSLCAGLAAAGGDPSTDQAFDNDHGYMLIGDPGNRATEGDEIEFPLVLPIGDVEYAFRLAQLEMTVGEQAEFARAYSPIYFKNNPELSRARNEFSGWSLDISPERVEVLVRSENEPGTMGWEYAARYINWLHHGKVNKEWAFETGVYDTSTFECEELPCSFPTGHPPEARYWIPSRNEWVKAAHWDPEKDNGVGGYWKYPNRTNEALRPGLLPEDGGQRNAGFDKDVYYPLDVGSFPDEPSPWGVLDLAGGEWEWVENLGSTPFSTSHWRGFDGTGWGTTVYNHPFDIRVDDHDLWNRFGGGQTFGARGVRVARMVAKPADIDLSGQVDWFDVSVFLDRFLSDDPSVDFRRDGVLNADDVWVFLGLMGLE